MLESKLMFDPVHRTLHDSGGKFLKKLSCPRHKAWDELQASSRDAATDRYCESCEKTVLDTAKIMVSELVSMVRLEPDVCLKVSVDQENLIIKVRHE